MQYITEDHNNGHTTTYKILSTGTAYHAETPQTVCDILERARDSRRRLKLFLGNSITGKDWNEEHDTIGTIGRSTGTIKIPLLIHNSRSHGGPAILDHCIVKIRDMKTGVVLYQHPKYQPPVIEIQPSDTPGYTHMLKINGQTYSQHKTEKSAKMLLSKIS